MILVWEKNISFKVSDIGPKDFENQIKELSSSDFILKGEFLENSVCPHYVDIAPAIVSPYGLNYSRDHAKKQFRRYSQEMPGLKEY